jgi:hypothetical protein
MLHCKDTPRSISIPQAPGTHALAIKPASIASMIPLSCGGHGPRLLLCLDIIIMLPAPSPSIAHAAMTLQSDFRESPNSAIGTPDVSRSLKS